MITDASILGVDPGLSGALAIVSHDGKLLHVEDMPTLEIVRNQRTKREIDVYALASFVACVKPDIAHAVVEKVGAMPGQGVTSMFSFGKSAGIIIGIIASNMLPMREYTPQSWKKKMGLQKGKGAARKRACELWPDKSEWFKRVKDDGRAEAALIAECGRRELTR